MRQKPDANVAAWLDEFPRQEVWITAISIFELRLGIELHTKGRRRSHLEESLAQIVDDGLHGQILSFDENAASAAAFISAKQRLAGRPNEICDTLIAGIIVARRADFATRNVRHFQDLDIRLINPWTT